MAILMTFIYESDPYPLKTYKQEKNERYMSSFEVKQLNLYSALYYSSLSLKRSYMARV